MSAVHIVAVSGGRYYKDKETLFEVLDEINATRGIRLLIQGECPVDDGGADLLARRWAISRQVNCLGVPPKVNKHGWPAAGPLRNEEMAKFKPNLWVLFPGNKGTASAKEVAQRHGIEVMEVKIRKIRATVRAMG